MKVVRDEATGRCLLWGEEIPEFVQIPAGAKVLTLDMTHEEFERMAYEEAGGDFGQIYLTDAPIASAGTEDKPKQEVLGGRRMAAHPPKQRFETFEEALEEHFRRAKKSPSAAITVADHSAARQIQMER